MNNKAATTMIPVIDAKRPLPPKTPLSSVVTLRKYPVQFLTEAPARYGDIYRLNLGLKYIVALNHPRHAKHVLVDHASRYKRGGPIVEMLRPYTGNGLTVSDGDYWLRQRRMMQPHFHHKRLANLTHLMVEAIEEGLTPWETAVETGESFVLLNAFSRITMKVIVRTMFGTTLAQSEANKAGELLTYLMSEMLQGALLGSLPRFLFFNQRRRFSNAIQEINGLIYEIIDRARAGDETSLIAMLLGAVDRETGASMTDVQVRDEAANIFSAGFETTSVALAWSIYFLSKYEDIHQKVQSEIDETLAGRTPTLADLAQLKYVKKFIQEVLRYRPPAWFFPRSAVEDDVIDGFHIPAGSPVFVMPYGIHYQPSLWPDPHRFDPDRFDHTPDRFTWVPFGAGQHKCIGNEFALMEAQLVLAIILQRYTITPVTDAKPNLVLTMRMKEFCVQLKKR